MNESAPYELVIAAIVDRTGWTYQEIVSAPQWLIDTLLLKWRLENEHDKERSKQ